MATKAFVVASNCRLSCRTRRQPSWLVGLVADLVDCQTGRASLARHHRNHFCIDDAFRMPARRLLFDNQADMRSWLFVPIGVLQNLHNPHIALANTRTHTHTHTCCGMRKLACKTIMCVSCELPIGLNATTHKRARRTQTHERNRACVCLWLSKMRALHALFFGKGELARRRVHLCRALRGYARTSLSHRAH